MSTPSMGLERRRQLATDVAFCLDEANVPNLLFGWLALTLAGSHKEYNDIDFVIPDIQMPSAIAVLVAAGYPLCTDMTCKELTYDRANFDSGSFHSVPSAHFHLDDGNYVLSLHVQSALLWWLPELKAGPPAADDPDLILSNDPQLPPYSKEGGSGPWMGGYHPVKVLNTNSLTEACMILFCRDWALDHHRKGLWTYMIIHLMDVSGFYVSKEVRPKSKPAWDCFNGRIPGVKTYWDEMRKLRDRMARANELGPLINGNTWAPPSDE